jgi:hypothetical protein
VVPDEEVGNFFRAVGPSRGRCLLARAAILPVDPGLPGRSASVAELEDGKADCTADEAGVPVEVTRYAADRLELAIVAPQPGFVVVSDTFHPRWSARVDGGSVPVLRADYLLKAVSVPAGSHRVLLDFEARGLLPALAAFTALGLAGLIGALGLGVVGLIRDVTSRGPEIR